MMNNQNVLTCVDCGADGEFTELLTTPAGLRCKACDYPVLQCELHLVRESNKNLKAENAKLEAEVDCMRQRVAKLKNESAYFRDGPCKRCGTHGSKCDECRHDGVWRDDMFTREATDDRAE